MKTSSKALGILLLLSGIVMARPHFAEKFQFRQPDGSTVAVQVTGDEYYQRVESPQGDLLLRDSTGWICFAVVSPDGNSILSTGTHYTGALRTLTPGLAAATPLSQKLDINPEKIGARRAVNIAKLGDMSKLRPFEDQSYLTRLKNAKPLAPGLAPAAPGIVKRNVVALTLLLDFPDVKSGITRTQVNDHMNGTNYTGFGNARSVKEQFLWVSDSALTYTNVVANFSTAVQPKSYYDNPIEYSGPRLMSMIDSALYRLQRSGFDFNQLSLDANGNFVALNVLYAGSPESGWAQGLWPHSGGYWGNFSVNGHRFGPYQLSDLGTELILSTIIHENEHMILGWPDTYCYNGDSDDHIGWVIPWLGKNPQINNPYFRDRSGWLTLTDITNAKTGQTFSLGANKPQALVHRGSAPNGINQLYYLEARKNGAKVGNGYITNNDEGVIVWQINLEGANTDVNSLNLVDVVPSTTTKAAFKPGIKTRFNPFEVPKALWPNGRSSELDVGDVSALAEVMTIKMGSPTVSVLNPDLSRATMNTTYSAQIKASGGAGAPYTILATSALPSGLSLSTGGILSGVPKTLGTYSFTVSVRDVANTATSSTVRITVGEALGIRYKYYEISGIRALPNFNLLVPKATGITDQFNLSTAQRGEEFAFVFDSYLNISVAGIYKFYTTSDDGSDLWIDGTRVVDNDGLHGWGEMSGSTYLTPGKHAIQVRYFEETGGEGLSVQWEGPGILRQAIPLERLLLNANQSPTIALTSPANNSSYTAPASLVISANASDTDGSISKVEFYNGSALLNSDIGAPYSFTWSNVGTGSYTIKAIAYDNQGASVTSTVSTVIVVAQSSSSSVTASSSSSVPYICGKVNENQSLTLSCPTGKVITAVQFASYGTATGVCGAYQLSTCNATNSTSLIDASCKGKSGCTIVASNAVFGDPCGGVLKNLTAQALCGVATSSSSVVVSSSSSIPNQVPIISLTSPTNNASFIAPASISITANASDVDGSIAKVEFYNGTTLLNSDVSTPYAYTWSNVAVGTYSIKAIAYDNKGASTTSALVAVLVKAPSSSSTVVSSSSSVIVSSSSTGTGLCANPVIVTSGGNKSVASAGTCFKLDTRNFKNGAMFSIRHTTSTAQTRTKWYGGTDQNVTSCAQKSQDLIGNGAQLNNVVVGKDAAGYSWIQILPINAVSTSVYLDVQNWQNGNGCSLKATQPAPVAPLFAGSVEGTTGTLQSQAITTFSWQNYRGIVEIMDVMGHHLATETWDGVSLSQRNHLKPGIYLLRSTDKLQSVRVFEIHSL